MPRDTLSVQTIYAEHVASVWRSLRRLGVEERDRPDVVQEVFLVAHRKLGDFDPNGRMSTWLFGICLRVASDYRRSARVRRELLVDPPAERASDLPDAHDHAENEEAREILYAILDEMTADQRVVFCAYELEELTGQEIAELLRVPLGTVKSRLRLARDAFRHGLARRASSPALPALAGEEP
jgi:RNA polymerase sigma-70 factor (ECF subfamily)